MNTATVSLGLADPTCCGTETVEVVSPELAEQVARVFKALGDPTRVTLLSLIASSPDGEACICDLTEPIGLSQPTVSHHMKLLSDAGLVTREQRGKWAHFRVVSTTINDLADALGLIVGSSSR